MNESTTSTDASSGVLDLFAYDDASPVETTTAQDGSDRGTSTNEQEQTTTETGQEQKQSSSVPNPEADNKTEQQQAEQPERPVEQKYVPRSEKRLLEIKEQIAEKKRVEERALQAIERLERMQMQQMQQHSPSTNPQAQILGSQDPIMIEPPKDPGFDEAALDKARKEAEESQDVTRLHQLLPLYRELDNYKRELWQWQNDNRTHVKEFQTTRKKLWDETVKRYPELQKTDSELYREANLLAQKLPEVLNRKQADGEALLVHVAAMRLERKRHATELGTLKEQNKQLTEKLNSLQKRLQPASQGVPKALSSAGEGSTPEERLLQRLEAA